MTSSPMPRFVDAHGENEKSPFPEREGAFSGRSGLSREAFQDVEWIS